MPRSLRIADVRVLLLSTYELGRQPFGLASPAAWLRHAGFEVSAVDLSRTRLDDGDVAGAGLVAFYLPMHTATRLALPVIRRVAVLAPQAHRCAFGLYAPPNRELLASCGAHTVLGGEFEADLLKLAQSVAAGGGAPAFDVSSDGPVPRLEFRVPDRTTLPPLDQYAGLMWPDGSRRVVGYAETTRGCKHLCRHCPVVPIYRGSFRVVDVDIVMADIRNQVAAGARHISFGDPDFWNGIGHARKVVGALASEFPDLTYDVTIKIEHLRRYADELPRLRETGCAFVTSAVESVDDEVLRQLEKGHTRADVEWVAERMRAIGLPLSPTFVAFTPWITPGGYRDLLLTMDRLELAEHVAPVQWAIRLLIPHGSRLLDLPDIEACRGPFDPGALAYPWRHADPRMDELQRRVMTLVEQRSGAGRAEIYSEVCAAAAEIDGTPAWPRVSPVRTGHAPLPYATEPWYCCAEPTEAQMSQV